MKHYLYAIGAILCWASLPAATGSGLADLSTEELMFFSFSSAAIFITALLGMFGAALVISSGKELNFGMEYMQGYMLALFCGLIWASFSVTLGHIRLKREPMTTFTIYAALLSAGLYRFTLPHEVPSVKSLLSAAYLGCIPLGLSFFLWNRALTGGNMVIIGFLSYFTPPLAVLLVALIHDEAVSPRVILGMVIIIAASIGGKMSLSLNKKYNTEYLGNPR